LRRDELAVIELLRQRGKAEPLKPVVETPEDAGETQSRTNTHDTAA
jgi:hypothetical protein